jgi:hypothetical protein
MNLTPHERTMLKFFQSEYFQSRFQKEAQSATSAVQHTAIDSQVGGDHYKSMAIQPWQVMRAVMTREEYTAYHIGTVMAYLMRHKAKGGEQDIKKAQHHLTELVEYLNDTKMA